MSELRATIKEAVQLATDAYELHGSDECFRVVEALRVLYYLTMPPPPREVAVRKDQPKQEREK